MNALQKLFSSGQLLGLALIVFFPEAVAHCAESNAILTTLVVFNRTNGSLPMAGLMLANDGNLYGTTYDGGAYLKNSENGAGYGTVFKINPEGKFTTLASLTSGTHPGGNLVQGEDGNLYGTTLMGGPLGDGTIFKMTSDGKITRLYSFGAYDERGGISTNGWQPVRLVRGKDGNLYGINSDYEFDGGGTIFRITPAGQLTTLQVFQGRNAVRPSGGLLAGADGNLYGNLTSGILFKMTLNGTLTTVFSCDGTNGNLPIAGLIRGKLGNFFGVTTHVANSSSVMVMDLTGKFTTLTKISGECPPGELIQATDGNFYGANPFGGANRMGTLFRLNSVGVVTILVEFTGRNGNQPNAELAEGKDGNLYGTTSGGFGSGGTVFRLSLNPNVINK